MPVITACVGETSLVKHLMKDLMHDRKVLGAAIRKLRQKTVDQYGSLLKKYLLRKHIGCKPWLRPYPLISGFEECHTPNGLIRCDVFPVIGHVQALLDDSIDINRLCNLKTFGIELAKKLVCLIL